MVNLPNVTIVCIDTKNHAGALKAIRKSLEQITPLSTIFFTDMKITVPGVEVIEIEKLTSKQAYSHFIVKELWRYLTTSHVLVIQHDGYILDANQWVEDYTDFDYIGAPWLYSDGSNMGNGGFSLRSKRLMWSLATEPAIAITHPEDEITCRLYRKYLESKWFQFAPDALANKFSFELNQPLQPTFGFHGHFWQPYRPIAVVTRKAAMGDVIMTEPLLERLHKDGYNVVLDTLPQFYELFRNHYFPVTVIHKTRIELLKRPETKFVSLDMAYENNPEQPVLKSYYEAAGITDGEMRNSRLVNYCTPETKLFKKYVVVHIDDTDMPWRNVGIEQEAWLEVWAWLTRMGYLVLQVGKGTGKMCGTKINTEGEGMLNFVIGGADLMIATDSMPLQLAVALGVPSVGFFGSVNASLRYSNFDRLKVVQGACEKAFCYHRVKGSTRGQECLMGDVIPRCTKHTAGDVINAINQLI